MPRWATGSADERESSADTAAARSSKRRGGESGRETPPKKTRTGRRLRSGSELPTPNQRSTRSTSGSTVARTTNTDASPAKKRPMAIRTGGRPGTSEAPSSSRQRNGRRYSPGFAIIPPKRPFTRRARLATSEESEELLEVQPTPRTTRTRVRQSTETKEDLEEELSPPGRRRRNRRIAASADDEGEAKEPAPQAVLRTRRSLARKASKIQNYDEEDEESEVEFVDLTQDDDSVGAAGPGPRTARSRMNLGPVPQPSPSVLRRLQPKERVESSQAESIENPDSSPRSSLPPETQLEQPRKRKITVVDGIEMEVFEDEEEESGGASLDLEMLGEEMEESYGQEELRGPSSDEKYRCSWDDCDLSFNTPDELADHVQRHADMYRSKPNTEGAQPAVAMRHSPGSSVRSSQRSTQSNAGSRTLDYLTGELERWRAEAIAYKAELGGARAEADKLRDGAKSQSLSVKILADERASLAKRAPELGAEFDAEFEQKLKAAKQEMENELKAALEGREELEKRANKLSELEAIQTATEAQLVDAKVKMEELDTTIRERDAAIDELQAKLKAATDDTDAGGTTTTVTLPADAPLGDQLRERDEVIASLRKQHKRTKKELKTAKSDLAFIREQYETASTSAVQEVKRADGLEVEMAKLREQLTLGLKQRDLFDKAALAAATADAAQARSQVNLLLEQSRRTDDTIRKKAAQHHALSKSNQELEVELHKARSKVHDLQTRNDELMTQNTQLRGKLMGAFDKIEESDDEADDEPAQGFMPMPTLVPDDNRAAAAVSNATLAAEAPVWQCKWLVDDRMCGLYFDTREELDGHGQGVHVCALDANQS